MQSLQPRKQPLHCTLADVLFTWRLQVLLRRPLISLQNHLLAGRERSGQYCGHAPNSPNVDEHGHHVSEMRTPGPSWFSTCSDSIAQAVNGTTSLDCESRAVGRVRLSHSDPVTDDKTSRMAKAITAHHISDLSNPRYDIACSLTESRSSACAPSAAKAETSARYHLREQCLLYLLPPAQNRAFNPLAPSAFCAVNALLGGQRGEQSGPTSE